MRKKLLSCLLLAWLLPVGVFADKEDLYVLHEGFEGGAIPAEWSQEYVSSYQQSWMVEKGAESSDPKGAQQGDYHVALRNQTTQTQHFVTRLVTPVFDVSETFQPILVFSHAQLQRTGDVDALRVYYRTSASARWVKIGEYLNKTKGWATDTIDLVAPSATYQLAFEGTDNYGYGVALDEIIVRPTPTCDDPRNLAIDGLTTNSAVLRWMGSLDTDSFNVVLSTKKINDSATADPSSIVKNEFVYDFLWSIDKLKQNTRYYAYIQAYCNTAKSEWSTIDFRTKNLVNVPYKQTFNMNYASGTISHVDYWTYGTNILKEDGTMEYMPFVNQSTAEGQRYNYSYNSTTCLVFTGARNISTYIPAGSYVYAATPEINVDKIKDLQVSFWGTCYDYVGDDYMSGLIVGVMTDPADFSTFTPLDTVYINEPKVYDYFTISLQNYTGAGKYIGFASNFRENKNIFYLDEVEIKQIPSIRDISKVQVTKYGGASFEINANLNGNQHVQLIVTKDTADSKTNRVILDPLTLPESCLLVNKELSVSDFPYNVELEQGGRFVQVYMRGVDGTQTGDFTLPVKVLVPMVLKDFPFITEFKEKDPSGIWMVQELYNYSSSSITSKYPFSVLTTKTNFCENYWPQMYNSGENVMILRKSFDAKTDCVQAVGDYVAFPAIGTQKNVMMRFNMQNRSNVQNSSRVAVGIMANPFDPMTFDTLAIYDGPLGTYKPFVISYADYEGEGKFPAIMAIDAENIYSNQTSYVSINDVTISLIEDCAVPTDIYCNPSFDQVTFTWKGNGMQKWVLKLYADEKGTTILKDTTIIASECTIEDLKPHTKYYYSIHTDCEGLLTDGDINIFTTECIPAETIPYIEDFESWKGGGGNVEKEPICWIMDRRTYYEEHSTSPSFYPYISTYGAYKGSKAFALGYNSNMSRPSIGYTVLPEMAEPLHKLQLTFYAKPNYISSVGDTIFVGAMTDPDNIATFDTLATCRLSKSDYEEFVLRLNTYNGEGKYLTFALGKGKASRIIYLDEVKVDYLSDCEKIQGVNARNATETGADIYWQKADATEWEVLLATTDTLTLGSVVKVDGEKILSTTTTTAMPFKVTNCPKTNTKYAVYVRSICGETNKGEWSNPTTFKTTCVAHTPGEIGVIDFSHADELDCWTVGVREGATSSNLPQRNSNGYLYMYNLAATDGAYAIMPPLNIDNITNLQVSFVAHGGADVTYLRELTVGVISNPNDLSTFVSVATLSLNRVSAVTAATHYGFDEAARYTVRFNEYTGDYNGDYGKQIMFLSESDDKKNYIYIDDIRIDTIGTCMEPVSVKAAELNAYDATIQWEDLGGDYQLQLFENKGVTLLKDTIVRGKNTVQLDNLEMLTTYKMQVRHICGVGDTSMWSNLTQFTTLCPVEYPLPYSEDFEQYASGAGNMPNCWEGFTNSSTAYPYVYSSAKKDGKNGFRLYRSTTVYSYAVLPKFELPINQLMLSFDWRSSSKSYPAYMCIGVATDITSAEAIESTFTQIDSIMVEKYVAANGFDYYSKSFTDYTGADGYIVFIAPIVDNYKNSGEIYIDNVYVEKSPTCFRPLNLSCQHATTQSVTLTWQPFGKETAWDVAYVAAGGQVDDATIVPATTTTFELTGLVHSTKYDIYVRANCGDGDVSDWSDPISVNTIYLVELADAHWNFDNPETQYQSELNTSSMYQLEEGWLFGNTKAETEASVIPYNCKDTKYTTGNKTRQKHYSLSDSCALQIGYTSSSKNGAYAILPEINADLNDLQIRFYGRALYATGSKVTNNDSVYYTTYSSGTSYKRSIKIGTLTDPYDLSTFQLLTDYTFKEVKSADNKKIVADGHWEEVVVPLYGAKGKYIAFVSDYPANNIIYIDDVVVEKESGCNFITGLELTDLTAFSANLVWFSSKKQWQVELRDAKGTVLKSENVDKPSYDISGLESLTEYTVAVRAVCSETTFSEWTLISFTTPCAPFEREAFAFNFEENLYKYISTLEIPQCWDAGQLIGTSTSYLPKSIKNTTTYQYSRNITDPVTDGRALQLYNTSTYADSYVVLPETDFKLDSVSLHFWARAAYFFSSKNSNKANQNRLYEANNKYQHSIVIGVISDITDLLTFEPLDTITYSQSWSSSTGVYAYNDPKGNDYWEEFLVPLKKYAGKGRIAILYPSNGQKSYFYIDDMEIVDGNFCSMATNLRVTNLHSTTADLSWVIVGKDSVHFQLSKSEDFDDQIVEDKVLVNSNGYYHATNLRPGQEYWFRVQHFCSEEEVADWAVSNKFVTDYVVRFAENFNVVRTYPINWLRAKGTPENVFTGQEELSAVDESSENWSRVPAGFISDNEICAATSTSTTISAYLSKYYWLISPTIDLTSLSVGTPIMLSFRLGLTNNDGEKPGKANATSNGDKYDKFIVAISENGGKTWKPDTYWSDDVADNASYSYTAIPYEGKLYYLDMTNYIGKRIQIAFISSSAGTNSRNTLHLANVQLNKVFTEKYQSSICQWEDYKDDYFNIDAYDLKVGATTTYETYTQTKLNGKQDTLVVLDLKVSPETTTTMTATVCEGADYTLDNFDIHNALSTNEYKQKLQNADGCDSIVSLTLNVTPRVRTQVEQTICQGDYYEFNGNRYYISTVHTDTLTSVVTGCDSIVTLYLTVNDILRGETDEHLCPGETVEFGKFGAISEAGKYIDTLKTALNCDSVATLYVYTHESAATTKRAAICQGDRYEDSYWAGLTKPGDYPTPHKTVWGCDSIVTLHLMVANLDNSGKIVLVDSVEVDDLPYVLNDEELLPATATEGVYTRPIKLACGDAIITIVVGKPTGLNSVFATSLAIMPNPVMVGQDIQVLGSFDSDAVLEVISTTGTCVYRNTHLTNPIVIPGLPVAGAYLVTITSNGQLYQAKLVVK